MRASLCWLVAPLLLAITSTHAQNNAVNSFLSEAYSVYTEVTSILASDAQTTATSTSSSSTSTTSSSSSSSITSINMKPSSSSPTTGSLAGAAATSSNAASSSSHGHSNTLAIVLGSVLGALVLGLLILSILICCHRRRRAGSSEHHILEPGDDEVDAWRGNSGHGPHQSGTFLGSHATAGSDHPMAAAAGPDMAEHPAFRNSHENPFVPVPPAPRRTAPNSRPGLTDGTVAGQEPFVSSSSGRTGAGSGESVPITGYRGSHHRGEALATGAGGAALGAAAMHHHNKNEAHELDSEQQKRWSGSSITRKPVPASLRTSNGSDAGLLQSNQAHELDGNSYNKPALSPFNSAGHARSPSQEELLTGAGAAGVGALGGAAVAEHRKQNDRSADSGFYSHQDGNRPEELAATSSGDLVSPISPIDNDTDNALPPDYAMVSNNGRGSYGSRQHSSVVPAAALGAHAGNRHARNSTPPAVPSRSPKRTRFSDIPYDEPGPMPVSHSNSDDSTYRLSSSIPGGWGREPPAVRDTTESDQHLRNSGINQHGRRSNSPRTSVEPRDFAMRDSGVSGMGPGARRQSPGSGMRPDGRRQSPNTRPNQTRRMSPGDITSERVRLSDLRAEEEHFERERQRGRRYGGMRNEWVGGSGYDGYQGPYHGVGQAL